MGLVSRERISMFIMFHRLVVLSCLMICQIASSSIAQENLLLILDGSGSMWGRVENKPKISIAKQVMENVVNESPDQLAMGLIVYGHRRKGDCSDLEIRVPLGGEKAKIESSLNAVMPKGKTPLAASLTMAGKILKEYESTTTIVLVSDGIETCQGDPCKVAATLREQGHKVVIHTVGFDVNNAAADQLSCIARAGGGRYFTANDSTSLESALKETQAAALTLKSAPMDPPEENPVVAQEEQKGPVLSKKIRLAGPGKVILKPASWVSLPKYWKLVEAETGEERGRSNQIETRVKEGEYQVIWRQDEHGFDDVPLTAVVNVKSGKTTELAIDTGIELHVPDVIEQPKWWGIAEVGTSKPLFTFAKGLGPYVVPAGEYSLLWRQSEHGSITVNLGKIVIKAGELNKVVADSGINLLPAEWMSSTKPYYFKLLDSEQKIVGQWRMFEAQLAPAGEYICIFRVTEHNHNDIHWGKVNIEEHGLTSVQMDSGIVFLHQEETNPPYRIFFSNLDTGHEVVLQNTWAPLPLPPGRYKIEWWESQHDSSRQTVVEEFTLEAGTALELEL